MRILLYGESAAPGSGAWCYASTLRRMGHLVAEFSDRYGLERYARSVPLRACRKVLGGPFPWHRASHGRALVEAVRASRSELVIVLKGLNVSRENVEESRSEGAIVVNLNHDDFFSKNRSNWSATQRKAIPAYDHVFTTREVNVEEVRPLNPRVHFLEFAYDPNIHRPVPFPEGERALWDRDVVFVGTWERERAAQLERLVRRVPGRYAIWGTQWEKLRRESPLAPYVHRRPIVLDEMAKAIGGAKIALAFLRKENRDDYTQRTFEIPACGGLLLAERTQRHLVYYREGVEAEFFDPSRDDELEGKIRGLLDDPSRRERIRQAGAAALARQHHTYEDRLRQLLAALRGREER